MPSLPPTPRNALPSGALPRLGVAPKSQSHDGSPCEIRGGVNTHAGLPLLIRSAITRSLYGPQAWKSQSATSKMAKPRAASIVGDDHTPPQPLLSTAPLSSTLVSNRQSGSPVARLAATKYPRWPFCPSDVTPNSTRFPATTGEEKMRASSWAGSAGASGRPV